MKARIMYIECKAADANRPARIGRVTFSKTGKTLSYGGRKFQALKGSEGASHYDLETNERYVILGCKKKGYVGDVQIEIDEDVRDEYWNVIRGWPSRTIRDRI